MLGDECLLFSQLVIVRGMDRHGLALLVLPFGVFDFFELNNLALVAGNDKALAVCFNRLDIESIARVLVLEVHL